MDNVRPFPLIEGEVVSRHPTGISARELMLKTFPPIKYVVRDYLVEGLTVFAGAPKLGKSWALLDWSLAIASGGLAFGSIMCTQGDVLYLALEDNLRRLQSRMKRMGMVEAPERLTFATEWSSLDDDCIERLENWVLDAPEPRAIMIDVYAKIRGQTGSREAQYDADYKNAAKIQSLAMKYNIAIILVHHTRKQDADDPFDSVSGTRGLTGAADTVMVLSRDKGSQQPIIYARGRDIPEIETAMAFDPTTGKWSILGDANMVAHTQERRDILELIGRSVDPMTPTEIAKALGKTSSTISHTLKKLYEDRKVEKKSQGRYTLLTPIHSIHSIQSE